MTFINQIFSSGNNKIAQLIMQDTSLKKKHTPVKNKNVSVRYKHSAIITHVSIQFFF